MSSNVNIYEINHNMDLINLCKLINTNFNRLAHTTSIIVQQEKPEVIKVHNELTHRDDDNCHPISAIANLTELLSSINEQLTIIEDDIETLQQSINTLNSKILQHTSELDDHERRIKALEDK